MGFICFALLFFVLCFGKSTRVKLSTDEGDISIVVSRGEMQAMTCGIKAGIDASVPKLMSGNRHVSYMRENILDKGYTNDEVISKIKDYLEKNNSGKVVSIEDEGFIFVGTSWIGKYISRIKEKDF